MDKRIRSARALACVGTAFILLPHASEALVLTLVTGEVTGTSLVVPGWLYVVSAVGVVGASIVWFKDQTLYIGERQKAPTGSAAKPKKRPSTRSKKSKTVAKKRAHATV